MISFHHLPPDSQKRYIEELAQHTLEIDQRHLSLDAMGVIIYLEFHNPSTSQISNAILMVSLAEFMQLTPDINQQAHDKKINFQVRLFALTHYLKNEMTQKGVPITRFIIPQN